MEPAREIPDDLLDMHASAWKNGIMRIPRCTQQPQRAMHLPRWGRALSHYLSYALSFSRSLALPFVAIIGFLWNVSRKRLVKNSATFFFDIIGIPEIPLWYTPYRMEGGIICDLSLLKDVYTQSKILRAYISII